MCRGACEIIHISGSVHKGARSSARVVMHRDQHADGTRKKKGTAIKPEGQSAKPISDKFIRSIIRNLTV